METAAAMVAGLRVVARTSACRVADGLVALEDAGPADAVAGRGTEALAGPPEPLWLGQVCAQGAPPSQRRKGCLVPDGKAPASAKKPGPPTSLWAKKVAPQQDAP